jgi:hypothetical protein
MHLVVDEPMHAISLGEAFEQVLLVNSGADPRIAGDPELERTVAFAR